MKPYSENINLGSFLQKELLLVPTSDPNNFTTKFIVLKHYISCARQQKKLQLGKKSMF